MRIKLPQPKYSGDVSLEECLAKRRSVRNFTGSPLTMEEMAQLLWAAQGVTAEPDRRTAPSAGALYPVDVYVAAGNVRDLPAGTYRYDPRRHELIITGEGDIRERLAGAALNQSAVRQAAIDIILTAAYQRTTRKYGDRGIRYVHMEIGHTAQNICLEATALGLGAVPVAAFSDNEVATLLRLPDDAEPLYIIPVGNY
ncbi:MAG: SagB/ThcOx family dehydrogenase [Deltaproteobacteria bacterium]|nr:SagB/ThcOx family dehydrogenase [Deltaproteobacteria bacterium]